MTPRPFQLMVDAGSHEEPGTRYFGSYEAAEKAVLELEEKWIPFTTITELTDSGLKLIRYQNGAKAQA
jgi:hypothetical protein